ncbi:putative E3 ubiquitin-protein ligase HERC4 [Holothuria leucospilota]|uniref:E3 ubiquitin-protein ligase HERC4 n=1 Tax=Holothuria leucospilota TaxID=206669 RepID=A0A9Q1CRC9_HOLLE|nr:putative E3 ubiquitin-protein ligase HERC4 [Holothuria leucospilota]
MESANPVKTIRQLLGFGNNPSQILYVSRDTLFEDNIAFFKNKFQSNRPISVRFVGEKAVDAGGPIRENFRILMRKLHAAELNMFFGTHSHNLLPSNNQMLLYSGMFEVLGNIAAGIINGVPLKLPLHPAVIDCILDRPRDEQFGKISIDDILDVDLKEFLTKILNCKEDDEMVTVINDEANPTHWLDNCGWPVSKQMTVSCKHEIVMCVMYHYIIDIRSSAITAIENGMKCNNRFPLKVLTPSLLGELLKPPLINATELQRLVQPSIDKLKADASEHATYITDLMKEISDTDANMMAVFTKAADCVYEDLTEIKLELNTFNRIEAFPIGNTCSATILFPVSFNSSSEFKTTVLMRMKEAVEFFGML